LKLAYSANAYMRYSVGEAIERIAALGYEGIELMADVPHLWPQIVTEKQIDEVRSRLAANKLAIVNINAFMMNAVRDFWHPSWIEPDESFRRLRIEHTKSALILAKKLGAPNITTEPGGPMPDQMHRSVAVEIFIEGLREALSVAELCNVRLLVEPEPGLLIESAEQFEALAARIDSPMFGLNFDIGHFFCVAEPLPETVARLRQYTAHYHVEDIAATRVHEHLIPGRGAIDFREVFAAIKRTGYDGWITVELYPYLDDPDAAGREAREFLTRIV
jgi:sugar phosphate isomerase/epimerase